MDEIIVHDTRDKPGKHENVDRWLTEHGYKIIRSKLWVGDVTFLHDQRICVDLKQNVLELASNVFQEHERFRDECIRAKDSGIQLIVLTQEVLPYGRLDMWRSPLYEHTNKWHHRGQPISRIDPARLRKALYTMQEEYSTKFRFCHPDDTGQRLIEYLKGERT